MSTASTWQRPAPRAGALARLPYSRLARFVVTGGTAALIQLGLLQILESLGVAALLANAFGFLVAAQVNFLLSQAFTWADRPPGAAPGEGVGRRWVRFHLAISGTALLNMVVFALAGLAVPSLIASAAGIGTAALANYLLADRVVFRPGDRPRFSLRQPRGQAKSIRQDEQENQDRRREGSRSPILQILFIQSKAFRTHWHRPALAAIVALSAGLNIVGLEREAYANTYYAAAVKSMLTNWDAFFFASFDAAGFVSVDKPPVGLWVQAISAKLFGFTGLSLLLPQAIAGILSVAVLYWLVRRAFGTAAGLVAALALAVTPIAVVTNRNNTMDSQLVLVLLLAAWAVTLAAERGRLRPLLLSAILLGVGYNVKMLQAYLVLPALWSAYLLWAPIALRRRMAHLTVATVLLLGVSLSWSLIVDLTPPEARPYVGSSGSNSALSLALGYNGLGRVTEALASRLPIPGLDGLTVDLTAAPGFAPGLGSPGLLRLFGTGLADEASWLLPLALFGLGVASWQFLPRPVGPARQAPSTPNRERRRRQGVALVVWGGWLAACLGYFSFARFYHVYYLIMLGPAIAALAGIGIVTCERAYREGRYAGWLLPIILATTAGVQARILTSYPAWSAWLTPLVLGGCGLAALLLVVRRKAADPRAALVAAGVGCLALLAAPTVWSGISVQNNNGAAWLPQAGPPLMMGFGGGGRGPGGPRFDGGLPSFAPPGGPPGRLGPDGGVQATVPNAGGQISRGPGGPGGGPGGGQRAMTFAGDQWNSLDPRLVQYLLANQGEATFLVATPTSSYASLFMLMTDQPAMALGGYQGWDRTLTPERLAALVADGVVRFFYVDGGPGAGGNPGAVDGRAPSGSSQDATSDLLAWVGTACAVVPPDQWQADSMGSTRRGGQQLYDCGAVVTPDAGADRSST